MIGADWMHDHSKSGHAVLRHQAISKKASFHWTGFIGNLPKYSINVRVASLQVTVAGFLPKSHGSKVPTLEGE